MAHNDSASASGSPLIYRIFLPTYVQLPTKMPFGGSPVLRGGENMFSSIG